jgi:hypothetical protein
MRDKQLVRSLIQKIRISDVFSFVAIVVSIYAAVTGHNQQQRVIQLETGFFRTVEAKVAPDLPVKTLPVAKFHSRSIAPPYLPQKPAAVVALWVEVRVTNNGLRTFSVEEVLGGVLLSADRSSSTLQDFGYLGLRELYRLPDKSEANLIHLPIIIESGEQIRFYRQLVLPIGSEAARLLKSSNYTTSSQDVLYNAVEEYNPGDFPLISSYLQVYVRYADGAFSTAEVSLF